MPLKSRLTLSAFFLASCVRAATIDVVFYDNRFGSIDDATGAYTQIGTLPLSASGGIAYMNGLVYLEDMGSDLFTVNPVTGASSLVGATGLTTTAGAFAGGSDGLFEVDYSSNLYQLDPNTGKAVLVGATGLAANNGNFDTSLSSDGNLLYYTAGRAGANDELYRINSATGIATDLGSTGVTGIAGSGFVNGSLELYQYGQNANYIYSAAANSNAFTRGPQLGAQIIDGGAYAGGASTPLNSPGAGLGAAVPEPSTFVLIGSGLFLIGLLGWRHRSPADVLQKPGALVQTGAPTSHLP